MTVLRDGEWNRIDPITLQLDSDPVTGQFEVDNADVMLISDSGVTELGDWAVDVDHFRIRAEACVRALMKRELDGKAFKP